jgi:hypothetical protein
VRTGGVDGSRTLVLTEETSDPLMLVSNTAGACMGSATPNDTAAAVVSFELNQDIELAANTNPGGWAEQVDKLFEINWPNTDVDVNQNVLATNASSSVQERGPRITVAGRTVTFTWNPSVGLATKDPEDVFNFAQWRLSTVQIQPAGKPGQRQTLGTFFPGANNILCQ